MKKNEIMGKNASFIKFGQLWFGFVVDFDEATQTATLRLTSRGIVKRKLEELTIHTTNGNE